MPSYRNRALCIFICCVGFISAFEELYSNKTYGNIDRRNLRSKKIINAGTKMKPPLMPPKGKGWKICCAEDDYKPNLEHNFVWPMETVERIYFFIHGMQFLLLE